MVVRIVSNREILLMLCYHHWLLLLLWINKMITIAIVVQGKWELRLISYEIDNLLHLLWFLRLLKNRLDINLRLHTCLNLRRCYCKWYLLLS